MALSEWLQYNAAPPSVINNFSGHTTINGVIIHVLVGLVDKEERKEEASCCKDKVRKSLKKYVFTYQFYLHTLETNNCLCWFHCQVKDTIKRSREK